MNPDFKDLLQALNAHGVRYLIIGGYAVIKYAEPRFTKDLDIWVSPDIENASKVYTALVEFGAPLFDLTPADFEDEGFFYTIGMPPNRIDILFDLHGVDPESAWENRVIGVWGNVEVGFIGRSDLIKNKLAAGRLQDLLDIEKLRETENNNDEN